MLADSKQSFLRKFNMAISENVSKECFTFIEAIELSSYDTEKLIKHFLIFLICILLIFF